jgi:hypothetical protein
VQVFNQCFWLETVFYYKLDLRGSESMLASEQQSDKLQRRDSEDTTEMLPMITCGKVGAGKIGEADFLIRAICMLFPKSPSTNISARR